MIGLAIDTSTNVMGVALANGQKVIAELITNEKKNHSVRLMPAIEHLLHEVDLTVKDLNTIIVAKGPGSYTGVRIGVTVAKTLAWTLNIPIVGVSSLEMLALNGRYFDGYVSPLIDARRGQIYTSLHQFKEGNPETVEKECIIQSERWGEKLKSLDKPILFLGNDVGKHEEQLQRALNEYAVFGKLAEQNPRPGELAVLGMRRKPEENVHLFTPDYVQMAEAEKKWLDAQKDGNESNERD